nr:putative ribonuclease H-like domain-containing protein [Tanacetum cinerariifolium]
SQGATPSNAGSQEDDSDSDDEPNVLIIQSTPTLVVPIIDEATTQNDGTKSDLAQINADNLDELAKLQALQRQEQAGKEKADRLGLAFLSLNPILGVGTASIGSPISASSTPQMSSCASPISADRHSSAAGKSHVSAGRPTGSAGRPVSAGKLTGSVGRPVSAGRPTGSAGRPVSAGRPTSSAGRPVPAGRPTSSVGRPVSAGRLSVPADRSSIPAGRILGKVTVSASSKRFLRTSSVENSDIHDGLKIFDCPKSGIFTFSSYDEDFSGPDANNLESSLNALADPDWVEAIQEEGIDYTDVFALVARIEAIRLFLVFASFIGFMVYQMDVKSAFLYGNIAEEIKEKNVPNEPITVHLYRSMIGCLMYLTATRPDIMFAVCAAARHQVTPKTSNLLSVKWIFKYLTVYPKLGLWYPRDSLFDLEAFS